MFDTVYYQFFTAFYILHKIFVAELILNESKTFFPLSRYLLSSDKVISKKYSSSSFQFY